MDKSRKWSLWFISMVTRRKQLSQEQTALSRPHQGLYSTSVVWLCRSHIMLGIRLKELNIELTQVDSELKGQFSSNLEATPSGFRFYLILANG